ncbi:Uncharacterised protein [Serratia marcescens]|uniref:Uncharacterized protein n=1 Tax=Serratia marcescens TaxID=615 RepID=A0A379Y5Q7_SERMA|nr:Uncharacterised protein [Serratia marcescens]
MLTYAIRKTTLCVALTLAVSAQALAATKSRSGIQWKANW